MGWVRGSAGDFKGTLWPEVRALASLLRTEAGMEGQSTLRLEDEGASCLRGKWKRRLLLRLMLCPPDDKITRKRF